MGLLENLSNMILGLKGQKPKFNAETKISTLHYNSSTLNDPKIIRNSSILDEKDALNLNKFKSSKGRKYTDNLPK
jgi:hypothetical protein